MAQNQVERWTAPVYLQNAALSFRLAGGVADLIAPRLTVTQRDSLLRVFGKDTMAEYNADWADGAIPNEVQESAANLAIRVNPRKLRVQKLNAEETQNGPAMVGGGVDVDVIKTQVVTNALKIAREARVARLATAASTYSSGHKVTKASGQEWNLTPANVLPDLETIVAAVEDSTLMDRNHITVGIPLGVFNQSVRYNASLAANIASTNTKIVTVDLLRDLLGVGRVVTLSSRTVGPKLKAGTDYATIVNGYTTTQLWGDTVGAWVVDESQNPEMPSFMRSPTNRTETAGQDMQIRRYEHHDPGAEASWVEAKEAVSEFITYADAGAIVINTSSTF